MTSRRDVDRLRDATRGVGKLVTRDLTRFWREYADQPPDVLRGALRAYVPGLVTRWGARAAEVSAQWYEETRAAYLAGDYRAILGETASPGAVEGSIRWALADPNYDRLARLAGATRRHVYYSARDTVARNVGRDPGRPRFARVPTGPRTCAFCELLGSRGFVYESRASAGELMRFHDGCDCQIVPEWDRQGHHIDGYDPDAMFDRYLQAREAAGSDDEEAILAKMRELFPRHYTDSGTDAERRLWSRQKKLAIDNGGELLTAHELTFIERFVGLGEQVHWIPRSQLRHPTNDFVWMNRGQIAVEVKRPKPNPALDSDLDSLTKRIERLIRDASRAAENHPTPIVKDNFIIDLDDRPIPDGLLDRLARYNFDPAQQAAPPIRRLWVMSRGVLTEVPLAKK